MRIFAALLVTSALAASACSKTDSPPPKAAEAAAPVTASGGGSTCPATGLWAECSIVYRLERSGLVPQVDSSAKPQEKELTGTPLIIKLGKSATLELYLYSDSSARIADAKKLDRTKLIDGTAQQTIERERTLIESANVIGLLTSLSSHQRERVSDALTAGAPQPDKPK
jgi:hypothetical protein